MTKHLGYLLILIFAVVSPAQAQPISSRALSSVAREIRQATTGHVRGTIRPPKTTAVSPGKVAASILAAPQAVRSPQAVLSHSGISEFHTFNPLNPDHQAAQAPVSVPPITRIQPQAVVTGSSSFTPLVPDYESIDLAAYLITPNTKPEFAKIIKSISEDIYKINPSRFSYTQEQLARIDEAKRYFFSLTPAQANDIDTIVSAPFRQYAMVLRSPTATEYGYYLMGNGFMPNFENPLLGTFSDDSGYIPTLWGNPKDGIFPWSIETSSLAKTNRPIFVLVEMHGGIGPDAEFLARPNPYQQISTGSLIEYIQRIRQATGTPELNLYVESCFSGGFLNEFERLPLSQRQGINVFVPTGSGQCTMHSKQYHTHTPGRDIRKELVEKMIQQIMDGEILTQANIAGESFNPLALAIEKANASSNYELAYLLGDMFNLQNTKQETVPLSSHYWQYLDEKAWYFIARVAYDEATARYGKIFEGSDQFSRSLNRLKENYAQKRDMDPMDLILEGMRWDAPFGFEPLSQ